MIAASRNADTKALITGGTQGLGFAIARRLIDEGATSLVISGRNMARGERAAAELSALGAQCTFIPADVSKLEDCSKLVARSISALGQVNALVNSAADTGRGSITNTTPDVFESHFNTNVRGPFFIMQGVIKHLLAEERSGSIVNILSMSSYVGQSFMTPYSASKAALSTLTKNVANAHRADHIRCNGINAGWMDTPGEANIQKIWHDADDDWLTKAEASMPMGQLVKPDQLAALITYMLSPEAGVMTGSIVDYDQNIAGTTPE